MLDKIWKFWIPVLILIISSACNSKSSNNENSLSEEEDGSVEKSKDGGMDGSEDDSGDDKDASDEQKDGETTETDLGPRCGDNIVQEELEEICDDGNLEDNDGCTSLCERSCVEDDECDDGNICNGIETCNKDFYCEFGKYEDDGENCGLEQSCFAGLCRPDVCGDNETQGSEECDDGDRLDDNGCTRQCKWTCERDEDCVDGDSCAGITCDQDKHTCTGDPKEDKASCEIVGSGDEGWCMKGVCVPENCGDGEVDEDSDEECDLGEENGEEGSTCSLRCKTTICGNGIVEEAEQCDDGNTKNFDTCNSECQVESWVRWTTMHLLKEPAPEWCVHKGKNQFSKAFPGAVIIPIINQEIDVLGILNDMLGSALDNCRTNSINIFHGSSDISYTTTDDEIYLTLYEGMLDEGETCEAPMEVDTKFKVSSSDVDAESAPILRVKAAQRPGVIQTLEPADIISQVPGMGSITLHDLMMLIEVDTDTLSKPKSPPEVADSVEIPEHMGFGDADESPYHPAGRLCGAVGAASMADQGVDEESRLSGCCKADGTMYDHCEEGDVPGVDCDTFLDVMKEGCLVCDLATTASSGVATCDDCTISLEIIRPAPPDIDTDDDGTADAYSIVLGIEGTRIRTTGVVAPEESEPEEED